MTRSQQETAAPRLLLETKFYVPQSSRARVPRARLSERLDGGTASKLVLVSAPAGFGKTTLLAEWLASGPAAPTDARRAAWLSLDREDNDPATFWTYLVAALQPVAPGVGASALALLQSSQPPPIQTVLTTLLNDLGALTDDVVLVLDDYHVIDTPDVHAGMAFLLDHLPPRLHLLIAGRADPPLPLPRLRARGELVELRAGDLRFAPEEAAAYLNGVMGLHLTAQDVAALEGRTEGWIAALQLAALSMQGRDDVAGFIAGFAGDARYVVDYLVEEVLQRQPAGVQAFLLQTSVLDRLSGPLCDAVTGQDAGKACWRHSTEATCSWSRSTTDAGGTATTTCSRTCCGPGCRTSSPTSSPRCTGARATGSSSRATGPSPSTTPWPLRTSRARRTWWSWRCPPCAGTGARRQRGAGWRCSPRTSSGSGRCSASTSWGSCCPPATSTVSSPACGTPSGGWT